jgi:hypothetical protein
VHRATRLDARSSESETDAWVRYLSTYFPAGRNDPRDARLLFTDWRCSLVKDQTLGPGIAATHGQSHVHWKRVDPDRRLMLNLEDLWTDYASSVDRFVAYLRETPDRRSVALGRRRQAEIVVEQYSVLVTSPIVGGVIGGSAMGSGAVRVPR